MKILLIDNHSKHREELIRILSDYGKVEIQDELAIDFEKTQYRLVVLSGGSNTPSVLHNSEFYKKEIVFTQTAVVPLLGICLGAEIVAAAFGAPLCDLGEVHRGDVLLTIQDRSFQEILGANMFHAYEAHKVGVQSLPSCFTELASSEHGPEIFSHKEYPIIGVQFHPEVNPDRRLFDWLLKKLID